MPVDCPPSIVGGRLGGTAACQAARSARHSLWNLQPARLGTSGRSRSSSSGAAATFGVTSESSPGPRPARARARRPDVLAPDGRGEAPLDPARAANRDLSPRLQRRSRLLQGRQFLDIHPCRRTGAMAFHIRDAHAEDVPALARLHVQTFNETHRGGRGGGPSIELREGQWREAFASPDKSWSCVVVEDDAGQACRLCEGDAP
jgi:hypothetical protein